MRWSYDGYDGHSELRVGVTLMVAGAVAAFAADFVAGSAVNGGSQMKGLCCLLREREAVH